MAALVAATFSSGSSLAAKQSRPPPNNIRPSVNRRKLQGLPDLPNFDLPGFDLPSFDPTTTNTLLAAMGFAAALVVGIIALVVWASKS